jgi:hypothetical protein
VISEHVIPRAAWWLPWLTSAGGVAVLAGTFCLMRWLTRRDLVTTGARR